MDFSRRGVVQKQKSIKSTSKRLVSKLWVAVFRICIAAVVSVAIICAMAGFGALKALTDTAPDITNINVVPTGYKSYSYYSDGTLAQTFIGEQSNRVYATIDEIPEIVQLCFVALEDERFYSHDGIDVRGIFRAAFSVLKTDGLDYGASTITQQLLKNMVFEGGNETNNIDKIRRKVQEQYLAIQLENVLSKDQILEYYLNYINLGNGAWGIKTAAQSYFGKDLSQLTMSEASVIAPIALSPTNRNPINHPEKNAERRQACLDNMLALGFCTEEEYNDAINDTVYDRIQDINTKKTTVTSSYSYFTDELIEQVLEDLQSELGITAMQASTMLYTGGISIYTTQDKTIQSIVDKYYTDETNFPEYGFGLDGGSCYELTYALSVNRPDGSVTHYQMADFLEYFADYQDSDHIYYHEDGSGKGISELTLDPDDTLDKIDEFADAMMEEGDEMQETKYFTPQPQSSFSVLEQSTGKVIALRGGRGEKTKSLTLNRATNTVRQVGSTFKVLASFLPAIDSGGMTLATVQDDTRYYYPGGKEVINWYTGFRGLQSLRSGISNSLNIVAVKTLQQIGAPLGFEYLEKLGFSTLVKSRTMPDGSVYSDINLAIALGGLTDGVTNLELTAAYAAIANSGVYNKPLYYTKIVDSNGKVLISKETESTQVMKTSTAWLLTSAMLDTVNSGTGGNMRFHDYSMPVAGKTGTASSKDRKNNDLWFVGYTPYYTAAIWTGYDNNFPQINKSYQQHLWRNIMEEIHSTLELPYVTYDTPDSIVTATVCTKCGKLAVEGLCDQAEGGNCMKTEYFAKGTVPTEKCTCHIKVTICSKSKKIAGEFCPQKRKKEKVYLIKDEASYEWPVETADTPYVLKSTDICDFHTGPAVVDTGEEDPDAPDTVPDESGEGLVPPDEGGDGADGFTGDTVPDTEINDGNGTSEPVEEDGTEGDTDEFLPDEPEADIPPEPEEDYVSENGIMP